MPISQHPEGPCSFEATTQFHILFSFHILYSFEVTAYFIALPVQELKCANRWIKPQTVMIPTEISVYR